MIKIIFRASSKFTTTCNKTVKSISIEPFFRPRESNTSFNGSPKCSETVDEFSAKPEPKICQFGKMQCLKCEYKSRKDSNLSYYTDEG